MPGDFRVELFDGTQSGNPGSYVLVRVFTGADTLVSQSTFPDRSSAHAAVIALRRVIRAMRDDTPAALAQ